MCGVEDDQGLETEPKPCDDGHMPDDTCTTAPAEPVENGGSQNADQALSDMSDVEAIPDAKRPKLGKHVKK